MAYTDDRTRDCLVEVLRMMADEFESQCLDVKPDDTWYAGYSKALGDTGRRLRRMAAEVEDGKPPRVPINMSSPLPEDEDAD